MAIALFLVTPSPHVGTDFALSLISLPFWVALFKVYRLYDRDSKRVSHSTVDDIPWLFHALVVGSLGLWAYSKVAWPDRIQLAQEATFFAVAFAGILLARAAVRSAITRWSPRERVLLVGDGPTAALLVRKMRLHPEYGLDPIGYLKSEDGSEEEIDGVRCVGTTDAGIQSAGQLAGVDRVILHQDLDEDVLLGIARRCSDLEIKISLVPNLVEILGSSVEVDDVEGVTLLGINPPAPDPLLACDEARARHRHRLRSAARDAAADADRRAGGQADLEGPGLLLPGAHRTGRASLPPL